MQSSDIRKAFLEFFQSHQHQVLASSSLVPVQDPTLLFTNAGMNQFKDIFTGKETRAYNKAVTSQKCVRAGGKHNDLENVGYTARHHTFFEMLGNFSFGDYFKQKAIEHAWNFSVKTLKLDPNRIHVSIFLDDDEAYSIWRNQIGVSEKNLVRFGEKDNFWAMGPVGPCGPCSELYYDQGENISGQKVGDDGERFLEFWNLVFMEFEQKQDGSRVKLPKPSIDTGMGLERITALVQKMPSNYDTDLFIPILDTIAKAAHLQSYIQSQHEQKISMRVIADHLRCMTFLINDGVEPSKDGRGYVLRRIMRRAMRHGRKLGFGDPFLFQLSQSVVEKMGETYTELKKNNRLIQNTIEKEERQFLQTIDRGMGLLENEVEKLKQTQSYVLSGDVAFHLYDTYGFPLDLTQDVLREHQLTVNEDQFRLSMENHREKARGSFKGSAVLKMDEHVTQWLREKRETLFLGYEMLLSESVVLHLICDEKEVNEAKQNDEILVLTDQTPFYGESGGQVGDIGAIYGKGFSLSVLDTKKPHSKITIHLCKVLEGTIKKGDAVTLEVDAISRKNAAISHTATHLLHGALIQILGQHVKQKGSLVSPERLRFDFTHPQALSLQTIQEIEQYINEKIFSNDSVATNTMKLDDAVASGAKALFDEKYTDVVRVVSVGQYSKELCGGTHLKSTGEIGLFKIIKEGSVSSGVRRIEAICSKRALMWMLDQDKMLKKLSSVLNVSVDQMENKTKELIDQVKESKKNKPKLESKTSNETIQNLKKCKMISCVLDGYDQKTMRELSDRLFQKHAPCTIVLFSKFENKVFCAIKVHASLNTIKANDLIQKILPIIEGSGGGRADFAQAGGLNASNIDQARSKIENELNRA